MSLFTPIWMTAELEGKKLDHALAKVEKMSQVMLEEVVSNAPNDTVRRAALRRMTDKDALSAFIQDAHEETAVFLIDETDDASLLEQVLRESIDSPLGNTSLEIITLHKLSQLRPVDLSAYNDLIDDRLRCVVECPVYWGFVFDDVAIYKAIELCSDSSLLIKLYTKCLSESDYHTNKYGQFMDYLKDNIFRTIRTAASTDALEAAIDVSPIGSEFKEAAKERLLSVVMHSGASQEELIAIAQQYPILTEKVFDRLTDERYIYKAVVATSDTEHVKKIKNPELLKEIALNDNLSLSTRLKAAKLVGITLKKKVPLYCCPDCRKPIIYTDAYESIDSYNRIRWLSCETNRCTSSKAYEPWNFLVKDIMVRLDEELLYICPSCNNIRRYSLSESRPNALCRTTPVCTCSSTEQPVAFKYHCEV